MSPFHRCLPPSIRNLFPPLLSIVHPFSFLSLPSDDRLVSDIAGINISRFSTLRALPHIYPPLPPPHAFPFLVFALHAPQLWVTTWLFPSSFYKPNFPLQPMVRSPTIEHCDEMTYSLPIHVGLKSPPCRLFFSPTICRADSSCWSPDKSEPLLGIRLRSSVPHFALINATLGPIPCKRRICIPCSDHEMNLNVFSLHGRIMTAFFPPSPDTPHPSRLSGSTLSMFVPPFLVTSRNRFTFSHPP